MTGTMTWVGMDVHARSTHAAAIDAMTGELVRRKFGPGVDEVVGWLQACRAPSGRAMRPVRRDTGCIAPRSRPVSRSR